MIKMAIMGAGSVAAKMAETVRSMDNVEAYAVASRDIKKAEIYAEKYNFTRAYGSYEKMLMDKNIDLVYVAVPHTLHCQCAIMCLEAGKNVLCEKPFSVNAAQAKEMIQTAKKKQLLLTEAIWTRYMPSREMIHEVIASGVIGEVTSLTANLGYELSGVRRIWEPELAGGALLDVGIYLIHFARMVFGEKEAEVTARAIFKGGVDMADSIVMTFEHGKAAAMQSNVYAVMNRKGCIFGTRGYMEITNINNPEEIRIFDAHYKEMKVLKVPEQITGYEYEVEACIRAIESHEIQCPEIPHSETIKIMEIIDSIRETWGAIIRIISEQ